MLRYVLLLIAAFCASAAFAAEAGKAALAELGRLNGTALACRHVDASMKVKESVAALAPKTRAFGEVFEEATSAAFLADPACPEKSRLLLAIDAAIIDLRLAFPAPKHATDTLTDEGGAEIEPRYALQDGSGRSYDNASFRGRLQLISFGYTSCPDVCPTTLSEMASLLKELGPEAARLQPIFISLDPERDTPAVLREYTALFDSRILGLTGSPEILAGVARNFKIRYARVQEPGAAAGSYSLDHSASLTLLAPDGRFLARFAYAMPLPELLARLREYLRAFPGAAPNSAP